MTHHARYCPNKAQKPIRGSLLNRSHPLARGLVICLPFNEYTGTITSCVLGSASFSFLGNAAWVGGGIYFDGSSALKDASPKLGAIGTGNYTFHIKLRSGSTTDYQTFISFTTSGGEYDPDFFTYSNALLSIYDNMSTLQSNLVHLANTDLNITYVRRGTGAGQTFVFRNYVKSSGFTHSDSMLLPTAIHIGAYDDAYSESLDNSIVERLYMWNRDLSDAEVAWLHREPYCMF